LNKFTRLLIFSRSTLEKYLPSRANLAEFPLDITIWRKWNSRFRILLPISLYFGGLASASGRFSFTEIIFLYRLNIASLLKKLWLLPVSRLWVFQLGKLWRKHLFRFSSLPWIVYENFFGWFSFLIIVPRSQRWPYWQWFRGFLLIFIFKI
jgi:hypothetical protein